MSAAAAKIIIKLVTDKRFWKFVGGLLVVVVLIVTAAGTSCTAHNLQSYAADQVAKDFAPLISSVNSEIEDGEELNTPLLYAAYITLFDNPQYQDKDTVRSQLIRCFYSETTKKIENVFGITVDETKRQYTLSLSQILIDYTSSSLSENVTAYESIVSKYCVQYGIPEYSSLVLAVMQNESGGTGNDPMQCSESPYNTKYPQKHNSITDPEYSIDIGVKYFASCLKAAKCKSPEDIPSISLALQGYNFGNGYIAWALEKNGYTQENAVEFSQTEATKLGWNSYGDINYVSHVLRYYSTTGEDNPNGGMFGYPIQVGKYTITSLFGSRTDPTGGGAEFHKGVDFAAPYATPIHASESGTVIYAQFGSYPYTGYGNIVVIRHSSSLVSMYGHCSQLLVTNGQKVQKGQVVALVGSTGDSTGNHCHFEIRLNDTNVNPMLYLK